MVTIEIPRVESLPECSDPLEHILTVFHFLLTSLTRYEQSMLHAECLPAAPNTIWYLKNGGLDGDAPLAILPSAFVSSCVGRVAVILGLNHQEGGYGRFEMKQGELRMDCRAFLSRSKASGFWIRVYASRVTES